MKFRILKNLIVLSNRNMREEGKFTVYEYIQISVYLFYHPVLLPWTCNINVLTNPTEELLGGRGIMAIIVCNIISNFCT